MVHQSQAAPLPPNVRSLNQPPILFSLASTLIEHRIRGGYWLLNKVRSSRALDRAVVHYNLTNGVVVGIPIFRQDTSWSRSYIMNYEHLLIDQFCASLASDDYTLFDCGADIGIFTVLVRTRRMLKRIVAFEPSADSYPYANANLTPLAPSVSVLNCAVGEHVGLGRLVRPPHDQSDHARYMEMSDEGDIKVDTIDAQQATGNVAIKIDVEGGEMAVLRGARKTIETADNCTISLEAHPLVAQRIGRDPIEMLRYINAIRPFRFVCISRKAVWPIDDLSKDLLSPDQRDVWNIVAVST